MKYFIIVLFTLKLWSQSTTDPIELRYLNACLNNQTSKISNISLSQDQYSFVLKSIILKGILSRDNFPKYLTNKNITKKEIPKIFEIAEKKKSLFCPLTKYIVNGLKNDYLKDKEKFIRYLPHLTPWLSYLKNSTSPEAIKPLYYKVDQQIKERLSIFSGKVEIQSFYLPANQETMIEKVPIIDMDAELDSIFETIE